MYRLLVTLKDTITFKAFKVSPIDRVDRAGAEASVVGVGVVAAVVSSTLLSITAVLGVAVDAYSVVHSPVVVSVMFGS